MRRDRDRQRWAIVATSLALLAAACGSGGTDDGDASGGGGGGGGDGGSVVFFGTGFHAVEEREAIESEVLADHEGDTDFVTVGTEAELIDRMVAEAETDRGEVSLVNGIHGDLVDLQSQGLLTDLSEVADELADAGIPRELLDLGKLGTDTQWYIPWLQASYVVAANTEALEYLPEGADVERLTYDEFLEWARTTAEEAGTPRFGFPAGEEGLMNRFLQGYLVPSFSGGVVTTFGDTAGWEYLAELWPSVHPQSITYEFMQDPLLNGEVLVAWDHTARLLAALESRPDDFVVVPAPSGPEGRAYMPVSQGLAIPRTSPNPEGAEDLIRYLLEPEVQGVTQNATGFLPVVDVGDDVELSPGAQLVVDAVAQQTEAEDSLVVSLPMGLGEQDEAFSDVFRNVFERVAVNGEDPARAVAPEAANLDELMQSTGAPCWDPDPPSDGEPCSVGGG
jgi:multiple sugar transport system substrate-binding protein